MARIDDRWNEHRQELEGAARAAGVDPGVMVKIAGFESGFNPSARPIAVSHPENNIVRQFDGTMAISSAYGYGQFLNATWQEMINKYGEKYGVEGAADLTRAQANAPELRTDTRLQAAMLAEFTRENVERAAQYGGADVAANVYAMHNLGTGDGPRFLEALRDHPQARVDSVLSAQVISGNPALYGDGSRTLSDAYAAMGQKMDQYARFADQVTHAERGDPVLSPGTGGDVTVAPSANMLVKGERGEAVRDLQGRLAALGYAGSDGRPLKADGDFGPNTDQAVRAFQQDHHLLVDGKAGTQTFNALMAAEALAAEKAGPTLPTQASTMADDSHPEHARYANVVQKLEGLEAQRAQAGLGPLFDDRKALENAAGQVAFESKVAGMRQVDAVVARPDGAGVFAVQGALGDPAAQRVYVDRAQAVGQDVAASTQQLEAFNRQFAVEQAQPSQVQAPAR